jgi:hypothetical protein
MGLQVRVKHALGSRLIELPDRTIDNPITVGRAAGVEVQVPSVSVAARHCVLFRYEGRWAVQDVQAANGEGTSGTFVNGQQVMDPVMLQIGDVISVGTETSAPTIEVDPAAAAEGRHGWAGDEMTAAPVVPGYAAPATYGVPGSYAASPGYVSTTGGTGGYTRAVPGRAAAPAPAAWDDHVAHGNGDHIDLSTAASTPSYTPSYRRKKQPQLSPTAIIVGAVVSLVIVTSAIWYFVSHEQQPQVVVVAPKIVDDSNHSNNMFGIGGGTTPDRSNEVVTPQPTPTHQQPPAVTPDDASSTPAPEPAAPAHPAPTPASPTPPTTPATGGPQVASVGKTPGSEGTAPANPGKTAPAAPTDEWTQMQDLYNAPTDPALAIFRFSDYQKHHPTEHADDLQKYMEDKFDHLWWDRIEQLFKKIDRLVKDAKTVQDQIFDETDKDMKKQEQDQLAKLKATEKLTKETIADKMGYKEEQPPPAGGAELAALREKRDNAKYTAWKKTTLNSIINNKGTTDWVADN